MRTKHRDLLSRYLATCSENKHCIQRLNWTISNAERVKKDPRLQIVR